MGVEKFPICMSKTMRKELIRQAKKADMTISEYVRHMIRGRMPLEEIKT